MTSREEFIKKLRETFKIEASEGIAEITASLMELEHEQSDERKTLLIEAIFRNAHSLKGAARSVNFNEIETTCQALEGVFSGLKNKSLNLHPQLFDLFHYVINLLTDLLAFPELKTGGALSVRHAEVIDLLNKASEGSVEFKAISFLPLNASTSTENEISESSLQQTPNPVEKIEPIETIPSAKPILSKSDGTIRISIEKLDKLLAQAEEMLATKQTFNHLGLGIKNLVNKIEALNKELSSTFPVIHEIQSRKVNGNNNNIESDQNCEHLIKDVVQFFEWSTSMVKSIEQDVYRLQKYTIQEEYSSSIKIEGLLDEVKQIISVPFSTLLDGYPKIVRDLSKDQGKLVAIEMEGSELEIDRRILEELRIPLLHLLRNSIDHGIEKPTERIRKNKSQTGTIKVAVDRLENNRVRISFSDDGAGVNLEKVKEKYLKYEKIKAKDKAIIDESTILNSLFKSGFTTSEMITDISGRGLGLSIVKEKLEHLGGTITLLNNEHSGVVFIIEIPLSLVTFRGVFLKAGEQEFALPTSKIERVLRIEKTAVKNIENKPNIAYLEGFIPLVYLTDVLEISNKDNGSEFIMVVVLKSSEQAVGFAIDEVLNEEMVLVKKFNSQLKRVRNIEGATVIGAGKVVPILNVSDLLKSALKVKTHSVQKQSTTKEKNSILVVEDSITSRMLLKNILETAGYKVFTAIDGIDGYTKLKENLVDLVVSDVDMPRMSGLDMTAKIRSDKALMDIPVVLVTSLSKREDRERGLDVGANGYIVKSNFDQSNLLEVIEKLIGN